MASSVKITDLTAKLQENIKDNPSIFTRKLVRELNVQLSPFTIYPDVEDQIPLTQLVTGDPLQPGNRGSFAPKADVSQFKDRIGLVKNCEVALKFAEAQIEQIWRSHLAKIEMATKSTPYDMPFSDLMMDQIMDSAINSLVRNAIFKGVLNAGGTTGSDLFDGILTIIAADITATTIPAANVFAGAAISASTAEAQINGVRDIVIGQAPEYITENLVCLVAPENAVHYNTNYRANNGGVVYNTAFNQANVEGLANCPIIPTIGMAGSDRVIITPDKNLAFFTDSLSKINEVKFWEDHWDLDAGIKFKAGADYHVAELIFTNDQA